MVEEKLDMIYSIDGYLQYGLEMEFIPAPRMKNFDWVVRIRRFNYNFEGWSDIGNDDYAETSFFVKDEDKERLGMLFMSTLTVYDNKKWGVGAPASLFKSIIEFVRENKVCDCEWYAGDDLDDLGLLEVDLDTAEYAGVVFFTDMNNEIIDCIAVPFNETEWFKLEKGDLNESFEKTE